MDDQTERDYYGQFTVGRDTYYLEGSPFDDCLYVFKIMSYADAVPMCTITGKDRNQSQELLLSGLIDVPDHYRSQLIFAAVNAYRLWRVDGPNAIGDGIDE